MPEPYYKLNMHMSSGKVFTIKQYDVTGLQQAEHDLNEINKQLRLASYDLIEPKKNLLIDARMVHAMEIETIKQNNNGMNETN